MSYFEYLDSERESGNLSDDDMVDMLSSFSEPGNAGETLRPDYEAMIKSLTISNMIKKAFDRVVASSGTPRSGLREPVSYVRSGYYTLLPGFVQLVSQLQNKDFIIVIHGPKRSIEDVSDELTDLFSGVHPCYSGNNKTVKILFDGSRGTPDLRPKASAFGAREDRKDGTYSLQFESREYAGPQECHAGLLFDICPFQKIVFINEEFMTGTFYDDSELQQIFFIGENGLPALFDPIDSAALELSALSNHSTISIDFTKAVQDSLYFVVEVEKAEDRFHEYFAGLSQTGVKPDQVTLPLQLRIPPTVDALSPKSYLNKFVMPTLLPVMEICCRDRPSDPLSFLACGLLRYKDTGFRTLKRDTTSSIA